MVPVDRERLEAVAENEKYTPKPVRFCPRSEGEKIEISDSFRVKETIMTLVTSRLLIVD